MVPKIYRDLSSLENLLWSIVANILVCKIPRSFERSSPSNFRTKGSFIQKTVEKVSNATFFRQIALQNVQPKTLGFLRLIFCNCYDYMETRFFTYLWPSQLFLCYVTIRDPKPTVILNFICCCAIVDIHWTFELSRSCFSGAFWLLFVILLQWSIHPIKRTLHQDGHSLHIQMVFTRNLCQWISIKRTQQSGHLKADKFSHSQNDFSFKIDLSKADRW